jgi:hypothetical protein
MAAAHVLKKTAFTVSRLDDEVRTITLFGGECPRKRHLWDNLAHSSLWWNESLAEKISYGLSDNFAADLGNRLRQRNVFGANLDAVLGVAALLDSSIAHQGGQPLAF